MNQNQMGDVIAFFRRRQGVEQQALAKVIGISVSYLSQIENNARKPSIKLLYHIGEALNVEVSLFLYEVVKNSTEEERKLFIKAKPMIDQMISILLGPPPKIKL